jgi:hypothetical protein
MRLLAAWEALRRAMGNGPRPVHPLGGLAPDVVPQLEAVRMETHEWITTTKRHDHLRGQQRVVAGVAHSTGAWIG